MPRNAAYSAPSEIVRIDARIPAHIKESVAVAAGLQGRSQTDFLIAALYEAAQKVISEHNMVRLCLDDQKTLALTLTTDVPPPKRFARLERAARDHKRTVDSR